MTIRTTITAGMTGLALVLSLGLMSGCSAISEIREAIPDVKVDEDGGSVTIDGGDGEDLTIDTEVSGELPDWFPGELPLPENYTVVNSSSVEYGEEGSMKSVVLTVPDDLDAVIARIESGLDEAGVTVEAHEIVDLTSGKTALFAVRVDGEGWQITVGDQGPEGEDVGLTYVSLKDGE